MRFRESGMPDQETWDTFFDPNTLLDDLGIRDLHGSVVDVGCGYGTFTIPAARKNTGTIYALDIDEEMIQNMGRAFLRFHVGPFLHPSAVTRQPTLFHFVTALYA